MSNSPTHTQRDDHHDTELDGGDGRAGAALGVKARPKGGGSRNRAAAAPGARSDSRDSRDDSADASRDDSVDFLLGYDRDEAIDALKTAGKVLTGVALTTAISALVIAGVREARDRYSGNGNRNVNGGGGGRGRSGGGSGAAGRSSGRRRGQTDLNDASREQLQRLPGVGRETATLIIRHRPYRSVAELKEVTGVRASAYRELRPHAKV